MNRRRVIRLLLGPGVWAIAMGCFVYAYRIGGGISWWQWFLFIVAGIILFARALEEE